MNTEQTATQIRASEIRRKQAFDLLATHPKLQAEKIARHYVEHSQVALQILKLLELDRLTDKRDSNVNSMINLLLSQIKENHRSDLGIELEWIRNKTPDYLSQALNEGDGTYKP